MKVIKLRVFDYLSILLSLTVIVLLSVSVYGGNTAARYVDIEASGKNYVYMLNKNQTVKVHGPLGITTIQIKNSTVFVTDSPCKDKLCIKALPLKKAGEWNACMPNKVFIRISGSKNTAVDSLSY